MNRAIWLGVAILAVLVVAFGVALLVHTIPDMVRGVAAHWRKAGKLAGEHAPDRFGDPATALADAVTCTLCRPGGRGFCTCTTVCVGVPQCVGDYTSMATLTVKDVRWLRKQGIKSGGGE